MEDQDPAKAAETESTFRGANDEIRAAAAAHGLDVERCMPFICECADPRCTTVIMLSLEEYNEVRANPRCFVHAVGHEDASPAVTVRETDRFILVEKVAEAGRVAADLAREAPTD